MSGEIYQDALMALAAAAHGAGRLAGADASVTIDNPLCGDRVTLDVRLADGTLAAVGHEVRGCALCQAAASVIGEAAPGRTPDSLRESAAALSALLRGGGAAAVPPSWPDLALFLPVAGHKSRYACVELPFLALVQALDAAMQGQSGSG